MKSRIDQASHHEYFQTRHQAFRDHITQAYQHYESEKKRMEKLEFWSKVAGHQGFPSDCNVYHFHPLVFVGNLMTNKRCFCYEQELVNVHCNGKGCDITHESYEKLADKLGVEKEVLQAVAEVESGTRGAFQRKDPKHATILFEYNYMRKNLIAEGVTNDSLIATYQKDT